MDEYFKRTILVPNTRGYTTEVLCKKKQCQTQKKTLK